MMVADQNFDGETLTVQTPAAPTKARRAQAYDRAEGATAWALQQARVDSAMVKAIARAFRWRKLLETGVHSTVEEIAAAEKINQSYICRILCLTLLAPDIVEAILNGRQPPTLQLYKLFEFDSLLIGPCSNRFFLR